MKLQEDAPFRIMVSRDFWLLWVIAVPLTVIVMVVWRVWYMDARGRLVDQLPPRQSGKHGYMGWKTLPQTLRKENEKEKGQVAIAMRELRSDV